jgi:16S rRNA (guanine527-N7)-methyltransferase
LTKIASAPDSKDALAQAIEAGSPALALNLKPAQIDALVQYLRLLARWNRVYNLSGIREPAAMVAPHILDSLSVQGFIAGPRVLDVGSGAGLPGIPLAVARPDFQFVLLDANSKKTRFMQQAVIELALGNVSVEQARIEDYRPQTGFDTVLCRAFASLHDFAARAAHVCAPQGRMLAMKAGLTRSEQQAAATGRVIMHQLKVPGIKGERQLVEISQARLKR